MQVPRLQDLDVRNKRVLVRVDFNVPLDKTGKITDDTRLRESLPTIRYILEKGGSAILMSHLGRPKGKPDPQYSLKVCASHLSALLGKPVLFHTDCVDEVAVNLSRTLKPGQVLLLENLRFHPEEENPEKDPSFTEKLASLGDLYVNDAFGTAHRAHASTAAVAKFFPGKRAAGLLLQKEIEQLSSLLSSPQHPFYAIIGGSKISSKIGVLQSLLGKADGLFIGGGMAYTFLSALDKKIGASLVEPAMIEKAKAFLASCQKQSVSVFLPEDHVIADTFSNDAQKKVVSADEGIPEKWQGMDVGPKTLATWEKALAKAKTIFWNGPVGVFEFSHFAQGTHALALFLANLDCVKVIGGGDSVAAVSALGLEQKFTHVSTGGGAALAFIEFGRLPGIDALNPSP